MSIDYSFLYTELLPDFDLYKQPGEQFESGHLTGNFTATTFPLPIR